MDFLVGRLADFNTSWHIVVPIGVGFPAHKVSMAVIA